MSLETMMNLWRIFTFFMLLVHVVALISTRRALVKKCATKLEFEAHRAYHCLMISQMGALVAAAEFFAQTARSFRDVFPGIIMVACFQVIGIMFVAQFKDYCLNSARNKEFGSNEATDSEINRPENSSCSRRSVPYIFIFCQILIFILLVVPLPPTITLAGLLVNLAIAIIFLLHVHRRKWLTDDSHLPEIIVLASLLRLAMNVNFSRLILQGNAGLHLSGLTFYLEQPSVAGLVCMVGASIILIAAQIFIIRKILGSLEKISKDSISKGSVSSEKLDASVSITEGQKNEREYSFDDCSDNGITARMDGSGAFMRNETIAGLVFIALNLIGGAILAIYDRGQSAGTALPQLIFLAASASYWSLLPSTIFFTAVMRILKNGLEKDTSA